MFVKQFPCSFSTRPVDFWTLHRTIPRLLREKSDSRQFSSVRRRSSRVCGWISGQNRALSVRQSPPAALWLQRAVRDFITGPAGPFRCSASTSALHCESHTATLTSCCTSLHFPLSDTRWRHWVIPHLIHPAHELFALGSLYLIYTLDLTGGYICNWIFGIILNIQFIWHPFHISMFLRNESQS